MEQALADLAQTTLVVGLAGLEIHALHRSALNLLLALR
jgi:hypothetical protein